MNDIDSPVASKERFLCDLSRWRQLLPSDFHAAFDYHADMLWDNRPPSDTAWQKSHDAETLVYFQDMLAEMLSHIECSPPERAKLECALPSPDKASHVSSVATPSPDLSVLAREEVLHEVETMMELPSHDNSERTTLAEFVLYSAGAIFALILAYLLRKPRQLTCPNFLLTVLYSVHRSLLCPSPMLLFHHFGGSYTRSQRPAFLAAACIPPYELPASRTPDPAIGNGPHARCSDAQPPTSPSHNARRYGVGGAHSAVLRRHC